MEHRDAAGEATGEARDSLRLQGDLGHQHDAAPAAGHASLQRVEIDLCLAASGHTVEQEHRRFCLGPFLRGG